MEKYISSSWIGRLGILKMSILPKLISSVTQCQWDPQEVFVKIDKLILKLIWKVKRLRMAKTRSLHWKLQGTD